ncbi:hypothetical protein CBS101457_000219 [Exobasidium rhododendri]|nr:hypothetical protein CBS101457_000219 [Exobasidium rhododendri]
MDGGHNHDDLLSHLNLGNVRTGRTSSNRSGRLDDIAQTARLSLNTHATAHYGSYTSRPTNPFLDDAPLYGGSIGDLSALQGGASHYNYDHELHNEHYYGVGLSGQNLPPLPPQADFIYLDKDVLGGDYSQPMHLGQDQASYPFNDASSFSFGQRQQHAGLQQSQPHQQPQFHQSDTFAHLVTQETDRAGPSSSSSHTLSPFDVFKQQYGQTPSSHASSSKRYIFPSLSFDVGNGETQYYEREKVALLFLQTHFYEYANLTPLPYVWHDPSEKCWRLLQPEQQNSIAKLINKKLFYQTQSIRDKMARELTVMLALALLSHDPIYIQSAIDVLYRSNHLRQSEEWMNKLNHEEAEKLVEQLVDASGQNEEFIRNYLSLKRVTADTAYSLYHATDAERNEYVCDVKISKTILKQIRDKEKAEKRSNPSQGPRRIHKDNDKYAPWKLDTTKEERSAIVQIVKRLFKIRTESWALRILQRENKGPNHGLGLRILEESRAGRSDQAILDMIVAATGVRPTRTQDSRHDCLW